MDALKGKGKGKGKRDWGKEKGKVREKDWPPRGREGKSERAEKGGRNPAAGSETVDCGVYGDCRDLYEKWRTELETIQIWRWTGKLCLFEKLKCLFLQKLNSKCKF